MKNRETVSENIRYSADRVFPAGFSFFIFISVSLWIGQYMYTFKEYAYREKKKTYFLFKIHII